MGIESKCMSWLKLYDQNGLKSKCGKVFLETDLSTLLKLLYDELTRTCYNRTSFALFAGTVSIFRYYTWRLSVDFHGRFLWIRRTKTDIYPKRKAEKIAENCWQATLTSDGSNDAGLSIDDIESRTAQYCDGYVSIWFAKVLGFCGSI